jgi:hypothetical protein
MLIALEVLAAFWVLGILMALLAIWIDSRKTHHHEP